MRIITDGNKTEIYATAGEHRAFVLVTTMKKLKLSYPFIVQELIISFSEEEMNSALRIDEVYSKTGGKIILTGG